jgi:hypothetical protein
MAGSVCNPIVMFSDLCRMAEPKKAVRDVSDASSKFEESNLCMIRGGTVVAL